MRIDDRTKILHAIKKLRVALNLTRAEMSGESHPNPKVLECRVQEMEEGLLIISRVLRNIHA